MTSSPLAPYSKDFSKLKASGATSARDLERDQRDGAFVMGRWEAELSDWRTHCIPNGWTVCCLPCVTIAQISARLEPGAYRSVFLTQLVLNLIVWALLVTEIVFLVQWWTDIVTEPVYPDSTIPLLKIWGCVLAMLPIAFIMGRFLSKLRTRVRERFQIPGSVKDDREKFVWCGTCAVAQMATQVKSYNPGSCEFTYVPDALPAYVA